MTYRSRWMIVALMVAGPQLWGCSQSTSAKGEAPKVEAASVEEGISRVTLTPKAAERLDIKMGAVSLAPAPQKTEGRVVASVDGAPSPSTAERKVVPYAAVVYEPHGEASVYTNPGPLTFVRAPIKIDHIDGDVAVLSEGPAAGTAVVTVGVAELFGIEFGVGED